MKRAILAELGESKKQFRPAGRCGAPADEPRWGEFRLLLRAGEFLRRMLRFGLPCCGNRQEIMTLR